MVPSPDGKHELVNWPEGILPQPSSAAADNTSRRVSLRLPSKRKQLPVESQTRPGSTEPDHPNFRPCRYASFVEEEAGRNSANSKEREVAATLAHGQIALHAAQKMQPSLETDLETDPETGFKLLLAVQRKAKAIIDQDAMPQQTTSFVTPWFCKNLPEGKQLGAEAKEHYSKGMASLASPVGGLFRPGTSGVDKAPQEMDQASVSKFCSRKAHMSKNDYLAKLLGTKSSSKQVKSLSIEKPSVSSPRSPKAQQETAMMDEMMRLCAWHEGDVEVCLQPGTIGSEADQKAARFSQEDSYAGVVNEAQVNSQLFAEVHGVDADLASVTGNMDQQVDYFEKRDALAWRSDSLLSGCSQAFKAPLLNCNAMAQASRYVGLRDVNHSCVEKTDNSLERSLHGREIEVVEWNSKDRRAVQQQQTKGVRLPLQVRDEMVTFVGQKVDSTCQSFIDSVRADIRRGGIAGAEVKEALINFLYQRTEQKRRKLKAKADRAKRNVRRSFFQQKTSNTKIGSASWVQLEDYVKVEMDKKLEEDELKRFLVLIPETIRASQQVANTVDEDGIPANEWDPQRRKKLLVKEKDILQQLLFRIEDSMTKRVKRIELMTSQRESLRSQCDEAVKAKPVLERKLENQHQLIEAFVDNINHLVEKQFEEELRTQEAKQQELVRVAWEDVWNKHKTQVKKLKQEIEDLHVQFSDKEGERKLWDVVREVRLMHAKIRDSKIKDLPEIRDQIIAQQSIMRSIAIPLNEVKVDLEELQGGAKIQESEFVDVEPVQGDAVELTPAELQQRLQKIAKFHARKREQIGNSKKANADYLYVLNVFRQGLVSLERTVRSGRQKLSDLRWHNQNLLEQIEYYNDQIMIMDHAKLPEIVTAYERADRVEEICHILLSQLAHIERTGLMWFACHHDTRLSDSLDWFEDMEDLLSRTSLLQGSSELRLHAIGPLCEEWRVFEAVAEWQASPLRVDLGALKLPGPFHRWMYHNAAEQLAGLTSKIARIAESLVPMIDEYDRLAEKRPQGIRAALRALVHCDMSKSRKDAYHAGVPPPDLELLAAASEDAEFDSDEDMPYIPIFDDDDVVHAVPAFASLRVDHSNLAALREHLNQEVSLLRQILWWELQIQNEISGKRSNKKRVSKSTKRSSNQVIGPSNDPSAEPTSLPTPTDQSANLSAIEASDPTQLLTAEPSVQGDDAKFHQSSPENNATPIEASQSFKNPEARKDIDPDSGQKARCGEDYGAIDSNSEPGSTVHDHNLYGVATDSKVDSSEDKTMELFAVACEGEDAPQVESNSTTANVGLPPSPSKKRRSVSRSFQRSGSSVVRAAGRITAMMSSTRSTGLTKVEESEEPADRSHTSNQEKGKEEIAVGPISPPSSQGQLGLQLTGISSISEATEVDTTVVSSHAKTTSLKFGESLKHQTQLQDDQKEQVQQQQEQQRGDNQQQLDWVQGPPISKASPQDQHAEAPDRAFEHHAANAQLDSLSPSCKRSMSRSSVSSGSESDSADGKPTLHGSTQSKAKLIKSIAETFKSHSAQDHEQVNETASPRQENKPVFDDNDTLNNMKVFRTKKKLLKNLMKEGFGLEKILEIIDENDNLRKFKMMQQDRVHGHAECYKILRQGVSDRFTRPGSPPLLFPEVFLESPLESEKDKTLQIAEPLSTEVGAVDHSALLPPPLAAMNSLPKRMSSQSRPSSRQKMRQRMEHTFSQTDLGGCIITGRNSPCPDEATLSAGTAPLPTMPCSASPLLLGTCLSSRQVPPNPSVRASPTSTPPKQAISDKGDVTIPRDSPASSPRSREPKGRASRTPTPEPPHDKYLQVAIPPGTRRRPPSPAIEDAEHLGFNYSGKEEFLENLVDVRKISKDILEEKNENMSQSIEPSVSEVEVQVASADVDHVEEAGAVHIIAGEANNYLCNEGGSLSSEWPQQHQDVEGVANDDRALPSSVRKRSRLESILSRVRQARAKESTHRAYVMPSPVPDSRPGVRPTPLAWLAEPGEHRFGSLLGFSRSSAAKAGLHQ